MTDRTGTGRALARALALALAACAVAAGPARAGEPDHEANPAEPGAPEEVARRLFPGEADVLLLMARLAAMPVAQAVNFRARGLTLAEVAVKLGLDPGELGLAPPPASAPPGRGEWRAFAAEGSAAVASDAAVAGAVLDAARLRGLEPEALAGEAPLPLDGEPGAPGHGEASARGADAGAAAGSGAADAGEALAEDARRLAELRSYAYSADAAQVERAQRGAGSRAGVVLALARAAGRPVDDVLAAARGGRALYHVALDLGVSPAVLFAPLPPEALAALPAPYRRAWEFWTANPGSRARGVFLDDDELARVERVGLALRVEGEPPERALARLGSAAAGAERTAAAR